MLSGLSFYLVPELFASVLTVEEQGGGRLAKQQRFFACLTPDDPHFHKPLLLSQLLLLWKKAPILSMALVFLRGSWQRLSKQPPGGFFFKPAIRSSACAVFFASFFPPPLPSPHLFHPNSTPLLFRPKGRVTWPGILKHNWKEQREGGEGVR